jgi:hypothetical protein
VSINDDGMFNDQGFHDDPRSPLTPL